ncbi:hypothetical protein [Cohnella rhizosphaerae]|uniref:hypothetical protein n=1 Tax=Cohnella rhizosphaerae TaxID=1457232 RepID=UPI0030B8AEB6
MLRPAAAEPGALALAPGTANVQAQEKPVLAILTIDDDLQLFRGNRQNFADLLQTGEEQGFLTYVVTVRNLKLTAPRVLGFTYNAPKDLWLKSWFPPSDARVQPHSAARGRETALGAQKAGQNRQSTRHGFFQPPVFQ